ncbi:hypothetical protein [Herminiimonas arsenitoxidans]|uniref:hypothetical protein n=1 Tax=Herminiimonas arsenitoxidans TaxID=1809410 RepID=UPI0009711751|nr:hypothetical protein [Herminiimonas arsenitoxidans]
MKPTRPSRFIAALLVLASMLFTQLAVAGYACPSFNAASFGEPMSMPMGSNQAMIWCGGSDKSQPGLCLAQDQSNNQSLDKPITPHASPFFPAALTLVIQNIEFVGGSAVEQPSTLLLTRSTAPPLSIRNCCFRI